MFQLEHIGIAVKSLEKSNPLFASLLGTEPYKLESVESEKVATSFFQVDNTKIELLEALAEESPIAKFIEKRGEGIHHIAFLVEDLESEIKRLKQEDFEFVNETPKIGADNKRIVFLHPKSTQGVLVELCEEIKS